MICSKNVHVIPKFNDAESYLELSEQYKCDISFEYNDFFNTDILDNQVKYKEIVNVYDSLKRDRSKDTLHGVFIDICPTSADTLIRESSLKRIEQSLDTAGILGCKAVVFHTNYIVNFKSNLYRDNWVKQTIEFYSKILDKYSCLDIYLENMFDENPMLLAQVASGMSNSRFGVCLDVAHAHISNTTLSIWFKELWPYLRHLHLNDNDKTSDSHSAIGQGSIDWQMIELLVKALPGEQSMLIEVGELDKLRKSFEYMRENRILLYTEEMERSNVNE